MEFKVTEQGVALSSVIYAETVEQSIDADFTLPDYCPDISRILKCKVVPKISSHSAASGILSVEGVAYITVIYTSGEMNEIRSYDHSHPFSKSVEIGGENPNTTIELSTSFINCRAVTQRRIDVHGAISLQIEACERHNINMVVDIDGESFEMLKDEVGITSLTGTAEKYLIITDEIALDSDLPPVQTIIRSGAWVVVEECKIISNKVVIKGEMNLESLYISDDDNSLQKFESQIPISQIIDIDGVTEGCYGIARLDVVSLELKPKSDINGEARGLNLTAKVAVKADAYCNTEMPLVKDAYSTTHEIESELKHHTFERIVGEINENFNQTRQMDVPGESVSEILDIWYETAVESVKHEGNNLNIAGKVMVSMIALDSAGSPTFYERPVDFEYAHNTTSTDNSIKCKPQIVVAAGKCNLVETGRIDISIELKISAQIFESFTLPVMVNVKIDKDKTKKIDERAALTIYYAQKSETVWEIAKRYNTSQNEIIELNDLSGEKLDANTMLLIPSVN